MYPFAGASVIGPELFDISSRFLVTERTVTDWEKFAESRGNPGNAAANCDPLIAVNHSWQVGGRAEFEKSSRRPLVRCLFRTIRKLRIRLLFLVAIHLAGGDNLLLLMRWDRFIVAEFHCERTLASRHTR